MQGFLCARAHGARGPVGIGWIPEASINAQGYIMNSIIYIVGLVVVIGFILRFLGVL